MRPLGYVMKNDVHLNAAAGGKAAQRACSCSNPETNVLDINEGCTGSIEKGSYVVKDWNDPPLHLYCAKRLRRTKVNEILADKQDLKDIGTTAEKETAQPWAPAIDLQTEERLAKANFRTAGYKSEQREKNTASLAFLLMHKRAGLLSFVLLRSSAFVLPGCPRGFQHGAALQRNMATSPQSTLDEIDKDGNVKRSASTFRNAVSPADPVHKPEAGRYHLYVCYACPWSQRALIAWAIKGLQDVIGMSATHPTWQKTRPDDDNDRHYGWAFASPDDPPFVPPSGHGSIPSGAGAIPDPLHDFKTVRQIYELAVGEGTLKKYTVPILWDEKTKTVVNNESSEIIQILNEAFNGVEGVGNPGLDLAPKTEQEKAWAAEVDGWMYDEVCNGVYKSGFATTQEAYDRAVTSLFDHLEKLDQVLSTRRYLAGDRVTLSDVRVFPSLVRFDEVYNVYFKCNKKRLVDYPNILNYVRDLYQTYPDGFAATTDMDHIRKHYYTSHPALNTYAIVPAGPNFLKTLGEPHDRDRTF
eukprot:g5592.t1